MLFGRTSERHRDAVAQGVIDSEADLLPLDAVLRGLQSAADEVLEDYRAPAVRRACLTWATLFRRHALSVLASSLNRSRSIQRGRQDSRELLEIGRNETAKWAAGHCSGDNFRADAVPLVCKTHES